MACGYTPSLVFVLQCLTYDFHCLACMLVRRSKTDAGVRIVPLNAEAWSAICVLRMRAHGFGTDAPEHYVFHRLWPKVDGTKPMKSWRSAWRSLRKAAGLPHLRYYNLRHQCVTEMLEAGVPEGVIRDVVGHLDPAMTRWYSHPRLAAKRAAVEAISRGGVLPAEPVIEGGSEGSYDTNHDTKDPSGKVTAGKSLKRWRALGDDFRTLPASELLGVFTQIDQMQLSI